MARSLTPQQQAFAVAYATGDTTGTAAAINAGYSPRTADSQASQLLKNPKIKAEINRIRERANATAVGSKAEALSRIWELANKAADEGNNRHANQGFELWLKATGNLTERHAIETEDITINLIRKRNGNADS